jgi:hypothetical protein
LAVVYCLIQNIGDTIAMENRSSAVFFTLSLPLARAMEVHA